MPTPLSGVTQHDSDTLARTIWGEAEPHDEADACAIAWVVRNRVQLPNWPTRVAAVCLQPYQFSCWNVDNPNLLAMQEVTIQERWFRRCRDIAEMVIAGGIPDPTSRSTHYYATWLKKTPKWARGHEPVHETPWGKFNHVYFNDIDTPPPASAAQALDQTRPISETRTAQGAGGAAAGGAAVLVDGIAETVSTLERGSSLLDGRGILMTVIGLAIVGFALWALYARIQDRKEGKR